MKTDIEMTATSDSARSVLRRALQDRDRARDARDEAKAALQGADAVVAESSKELARLTKARDVAEAAHASEIASAIRRGKTPNATMPDAVINAQHALSESESRNRMAVTARATIASELVAAEAAVKRAEAAVTSAAFSVLVAEASPLADKLWEALAQLLDIRDALAGLPSLPAHFVPGALPSLPAQLVNAVADASAMEYALGLIRPQRTILAAPPQAIAATRWRAYLSALAENPDAKLADIATEERPGAIGAAA